MIHKFFFLFEVFTHEVEQKLLVTCDILSKELPHEEEIKRIFADYANDVFHSVDYAHGFVKKRASCYDNFSMSIQASYDHYSIPKIDDGDYYEAFEIGYPSSSDHFFKCYGDSDNVIFSYTPAWLVGATLIFHDVITCSSDDEEKLKSEYSDAPYAKLMARLIKEKIKILNISEVK